MTQFITGTFSDAAPANSAVGEIVATGRSLRDISVIMSGETQVRFWGAPSARTQSSNAAQGGNRTAVAGGPIGTILAGASQSDAVATMVVGSGTLMRFVVAGPAAAVLADDPRDSASGGSTLQALARRLGMQQYDAEQLEREASSGAIVVGITTRNGERATVWRILHGNAVRHVMETLTAS